MVTWAGAIVETKSRSDFEALASSYGVALEGRATRWVLVECDVGLGSLRTPGFAAALSRDLGGTVIAFFLQTTASVEEIEHFQAGELVRKLEYSHDQGGWTKIEGTPQAWEAEYFFAEGEGTAPGQEWPLNLGDEIEDDELARYDRARAVRDATGVMDLLSGGSVWGLERLCRHFGVDPRVPGARYAPPRRRKPRLIAIAILLLLAGVSVYLALGAGR